MPEVIINYWAVLVAAIASMVIGALWYSPLVFGRSWMNLMGMTQDKINDAKKKGMTKYYLAGFIGSLVMSYVLAHFVDYAEATTITGGLQLGFWVWIGFLAPVMMSSVLWERRPFKLYIINVSYQLVNLLVMSLILAVWV